MFQNAISAFLPNMLKRVPFVSMVLIVMFSPLESTVDQLSAKFPAPKSLGRGIPINPH